jgi:outer membrane protein insertion porin family
MTGWLVLAVAGFAAPQALAPESASRPPVAVAEVAPSRYEGWMVSEIRFEAGARGGKEERLRGLIVQPTGQPLDHRLLAQSVRQLLATGRYANVEVEAEATAEHQVALSFRFQPYYFVGSVTVEGAPSRPTEGQIANASKLDLGERLSDQKLKTATEKITQLLLDSGYYRAKVSHREHADPVTQQVSITFTVNAGEPARVGEVKVETAPGVSEVQVRDIARLHSGDRVTADRLRNGLERLRNYFRKRGRLTAQVTVTERNYRPERNVLDYSLRIEAGPLVEIVVEGFKVSRGVLRDRIPVYEENAVDEDLLNEGRINLRDYLQTRGYFDAEVQVSQKADADGKRLRIIYEVNRGDRHRVVKEEVKGNQYFGTQELFSRMQVQPAGRLLSHGRFSPSLLAQDIRGLQELYRAQGFQEISIQSQVTDNYQGKEDQLAVFLTVYEGPQMLVNSVRFAGNQSAPEEDLRNRITYSEGQPYSEYNLANDRDEILTYYLNHGYPDARLDVTSQPAATEANRRDVTYTIREGERVVVDQVLISGLEHTRPMVVEREVKLHPGTSLSRQQMLDTQRSLYDLGIFSQVDVAVQDPEGRERDKNILVDVREAKRYTFNYGIGFEAQTGQPGRAANLTQGRPGISPRVSFDVTRLNLFGLNHTLVFKSNVGALQQRGLVSYEIPRWLGSQRLRLTFSTFYDNTLNVTTFTSRRVEGSIQVENNLDARVNPERRVNTLYYRFAFRRVKADIAPNFDPTLVPLLSQPARVGGPGFSYFRDRRDSQIEPGNGNFNTVDFSWASRYFGSAADFTRLAVQNSTYYRLGKRRSGKTGMVLARSTRIAIENAFDRTAIPAANVPIPAGFVPIPLPERLFAGGGNSHRGFSINQAGPRDLQSGQPLGGSGLFLNNLELRLPPPTLPYVKDNLSFVLFNDLGNVFDKPENILKGLGHLRQGNRSDCQSLTPSASGAVCDFNYLVAAVGAGVHYRTPIGPVRLDFGYNLNPPVFPVRVSSDPTRPPHIESVRRLSIFFSIGQTF